MANTFKNLEQGMRSLNRAIRVETQERMKSTAKVALKKSVRGTPVDTAKARSNWIVTLGRPTRRQRPGPFKAREKAGIRERINAKAAITAGDAVINRFKLGRFSFLGRSVIFIQNNTRYIEDLDKGSSKQAPAGFSDMAAQSALAEAKKFKAKI